MTTLSHNDLCRLSRVFVAAGLWTIQDQRINEWLKEQIKAAQAAEDAPRKERPQ
jgi:hypothetical protein